MTQEYPNLQAVLDGRVSGQTSEWPQVRVELRALLAARAQDQREMERLRAVEKAVKAELAEAPDLREWGNLRDALTQAKEWQP